ncbi:MAG: Stp1/IreP family PP2C-type Ser/Thr phosphatase [Anaerolineae bacterium]|nr:Stp1/IreP family PP2C-type Ser/Thr phosphatase [Anaerolineae bacterium]NUQ02982.1 Stp1/IreP family PP2C-type Ser/Thr phosphatase [Anaerolineae bacterium]
MGGSDHMGRLRSAACTSIGRVRENNEDNVQLWQQDGYVIAVVADGMGGAAAGEQASQIAVDAIQTMLNTYQTDSHVLDERPDEQIVSIILDAIRKANASILRRATDDPELRGMGTTMTVTFARPNRALIAHVGDSRAYLIDSRSKRINQITADHSFVEALVAAGHLTQEQAEEHPMRNVLYRALGQNEDIDIDIYEIRLRYGDRIVMCSDGLTHHVKSMEIAAIASEEGDPSTCCDKLIALANERGGEDNISVVVIGAEIGLAERATIELQSLDLSVDDTLVLKNAADQTKLDPLEGGEDETMPGSSEN